MLAKSSKSRFAAIAIMALGVSTFMGTSAAVATGVSVSGTVGECSTPSTVTAPSVDFGAVPKGATVIEILRPTVTPGKTALCDDKDSYVTASIDGFHGEAGDSPQGLKVILMIGDLTPGSFGVTAIVPTGAATGPFGATVTLTLTDIG
jgi:hypothetical protein